MSDTVKISATKFDELVARIASLEKAVTSLVEKLGDQEPEYGTDEWWEWSDKKALYDIHKGHYIEFSSAKDMVSHLKKL